MTDCFGEEIFGQLVQVQKQQFKNVLLSQNTLQNCQQHSNSTSNQLKPHNCFQPSVLFPKSHQNLKQDQQQHFNTQISLQKQFSCKSTSIGHSKTAKCFHQLKAIFTSQSFPCYSCKNEQNNNELCVICQGNGIIGGSSKIIKLMQYIMEFKCGLIPSYKQEQKQKKETNVHFNSHIVPKFTPNWRTHEGFKCNGCQLDPIVGVRYHCPHPCCNDDYDLCQNCFCKFNHPHELQQFGYNLMQEKLENMKVKMFKACSKDTMSNKNTQLF